MLKKWLRKYNEIVFEWGDGKTSPLLCVIIEYLDNNVVVFAKIIIEIKGKKYAIHELCLLAELEKMKLDRVLAEAAASKEVAL